MLDAYNSLLTKEDLCVILNITEPVAYKLMNKNIIPYFKINNKRYIYKDELIYVLINS